MCERCMVSMYICMYVRCERWDRLDWLHWLRMFKEFKCPLFLFCLTWPGHTMGKTNTERSQLLCKCAASVGVKCCCYVVMLQGQVTSCHRPQAKAKGRQAGCQAKGKATRARAGQAKGMGMGKAFKGICFCMYYGVWWRSERWDRIIESRSMLQEHTAKQHYILLLPLPLPHMPCTLLPCHIATQMNPTTIHPQSNYICYMIHLLLHSSCVKSVTVSLGIVSGFYRPETGWGRLRFGINVRSYLFRARIRDLHWISRWRWSVECQSNQVPIP